MYRLALTSESEERVFVMPMDEEQIEREDVEVVIGFGIMELGKQGYKGISPEQVFQDIVFDKQNFNTSLLVHETLPELLKHVGYSLPVYKYIADEEYDDLPNVLKRFSTYCFDDLANKTILNARSRFNFTSIEEAIEAGGDSLKKQIYNLQTVAEEYMDKNKLEKFLQATLSLFPGVLNDGETMVKTTIKKLIKMLDYLKFKKYANH